MESEGPEPLTGSTPRSKSKFFFLSFVAAASLLVGVVMATVLLAFYRPFQGASPSIANYGWGSLSCSMFKDNVNFTVQFYHFETGQYMMFVDDLIGGEYREEYTVGCDSSDKTCATSFYATDDNHKVERRPTT